MTVDDIAPLFVAAIIAGLLAVIIGGVCAWQQQQQRSAAGLFDARPDYDWASSESTKLFDQEASDGEGATPTDDTGYVDGAVDYREGRS